MGKYGEGPNYVNKNQLKERCGACLAPSNLKSLKAFDLLKHAAQYEAVNDQELEATWPTSTSTIKAYLYSHVSDSYMRVAIDAYVVQYSQLFQRGSIISNLLALTQYQAVGQQPGQDNGQLPRWSVHLPQNTAANAIFDFLTSSTHAQCFLPERWRLERGEKSAPRHAMLVQLMDMHVTEAGSSVGELLRHMLPAWEATMEPSGWDNALITMNTKYVANTQVDITCHLKDRAKKYLRQLDLHPDSPRDLIVDTFEKRPWPLVVHDDDYSLVMGLRQAFELKAGQYHRKQAPWTKAAATFRHTSRSCA
eukprot:jgi/Chrzof1/8001/UNPLg00052.t1